MKMVFINVLAALVLLVLPARAEEKLLHIDAAEDPDAVLHNPEMGWVLYENYPVDRNPAGASTMVTLPDENFAGVDHVAVMFAWSDVEPKQNVFDFSAIDDAYDYWAKRGKTIQLRLSTESLLWWNNATPPSGVGVPNWLLDQLPESHKQTRKLEGIAYNVVDARNSLYLRRLERFLFETARHYSGKRSVSLIDLRGFGVWGEWHSGYKYASINDRRAALSGVIDRYAKAFAPTPVAVSYSYDPDGPKELYAGPTNRYDPAAVAAYDQFIRYSAFDHALEVPNVTFRRDGAGGAVHSNERKLCEEAFIKHNKAPFFCEFMDGYETSKKGKKGWIEWKLDDALSLHPNYICLLGYQCADAKAFLTERQDLINLGLRKMGYRLVPKQVSYPAAVAAGASIHIDLEWENEGVGRALRNYELRFSIANGEQLFEARAGEIETSRWVKGSRYKVSKDVSFKDAPPGRYDLRICLVDPKDQKTIALPLKSEAKKGWYSIGSLTVGK